MIRSNIRLIGLMSYQIRIPVGYQILKDGDGKIVKDGDGKTVLVPKE